MSTESLREWLNPHAAQIRRNNETQSGLAVLKEMIKKGSPKQREQIDQSEAELRAATKDLERMARGLKPKNRQEQDAPENAPTGDTAQNAGARPTKREAEARALSMFMPSPTGRSGPNPNDPILSEPARPRTEVQRPRRAVKQEWLKPIPDELAEQLARLDDDEDIDHKANLAKHKKLKVVVPPLDRETTPWYTRHTTRIESVTIYADPPEHRATTKRDASVHWVDAENDGPIPTTRVIGENERDEVRVLIAGGPESNNQNGVWRALDKVLDRSRAANMHLIVASAAKPVFAETREARQKAEKAYSTAKANWDNLRQELLDTTGEFNAADHPPPARPGSPGAYIGQGPGYLATRWVQDKGPDANVTYEKFKNRWGTPAPDGEGKASSRQVREERNHRMLEHGKPHVVIIFPDSAEDPTTLHLANAATVRGIPVEIGDDDGRTYPFNDFKTDRYTPPERNEDDLAAAEMDTPTGLDRPTGPAPPPTNLSDIMSATAAPLPQTPAPADEPAPEAARPAPEAPSTAASPPQAASQPASQPEDDSPPWDDEDDDEGRDDERYAESPPSQPEAGGPRPSMTASPQLSSLMSAQAAPVRGKGRPTGGGTPAPGAGTARDRKTGGRS